MKRMMMAALAVEMSAIVLAGEIDLSKVEVVRAARENAQQKVAADDLVKHLRLVCGAVEEAGGFRFVFGRPEGEPPAEPLTAHARRDGNTVWFWGDDRAYGKLPCYGSSFAVSQFLEASLGVRWVRPGDDGIAWRAGVKPTLADGWRWDWTYPNRTSLMRGTDVEWGRRLRYFEHRPFPYRHAFADWQRKYLKEHPEYFGLSPYGKRGLPDYHARLAKLCLANPAVIERIVGNWQAAGTNAYINACPNDGTPGYCFCEECRKLDADEPGENFYANKADRYYNFWNRLVERAREIRPDVTVTTYLYSYYRFPPRRERIAHPDNMIFGWVPCQGDDFSRNLAKLREAGMKRFFLRPNFMCYRDKVPRALERYLYDTYHECRAAGGIGFDYDGSYKDILGLEYYLLFRQTAFPELTFEQICEEYYSQYGALAPVAKAYYERVRTRCEASRAEMFRKMARTNALDDSELRGFSLACHTEKELSDDAAMLTAADTTGLSAPELRRWQAFVAQVTGYVAAYREASEKAARPKTVSPDGWRSSFDLPSMDGWTKRDNFLEITKDTASFDRYSVRCKTTEAPGIGIWRRDVPVVAGAKYELTYDVKMDEGVSACAIRVACVKPGEKALATLARFPAAYKDVFWQSAGGTFTVPEGVSHLALYFHTGVGGEGRFAYVDNIVLKRLEKDLYLLIGQSNMAGRGLLTECARVSAKNVDKLTEDGRWVAAEEPIHADKPSAGAGLAATFAREMAKGGGVRIGLIPCAVGGTGIQRWTKGGDLYERAVARARLAMRDGRLKGILWHQGEHDAKCVADAEAWGDGFASMVAALRKDLGDVPVVAGELGRYLDDYRPPASAGTTGLVWRVINAQLHRLEGRIPNFAVVSSEGLAPNADNLHFNTASLRTFGQRYAQALKGLSAGEARGGMRAAPAAPVIRTDANRNATPLDVGFRRIGTLTPRSVTEVGPANWTIDGAPVDRDFAEFDKYCDYLPALGVAKIRVLTGWAKCERVRGRIDVAWLDHIVDWCRAHGISPILELSYGNPIYPGAGGAGLSDGIPTSAEGLAAWDRWVDFLGAHFKDRVDEWAMWNEPDISTSPDNTYEKVAAFNIRSAKILRRHMPNCVLHGLSAAKRGWIVPCVKAMGEDAKMFNTFVYHGYAENPDWSYPGVRQTKAELQALLPTARLRQGENGCSSEWIDRFALRGMPWSEVSQAKWDLRRMLGDLGHDIESGLFCIVDINYQPPTFPTFYCNRKGYLRVNASNDVIRIKRAYYAVQNAVSVFDASVKHVTDAPEAACGDRTVSLYEYRTANGSPLLAFWCHGNVKPTPTNTAQTFLGTGDFGVEIDLHARPSDSFETRGVAFTWKGRPFADPVWIDLMTGWVYELPAELQIVHACGIDFAEIPVYDSPCLLTERTAVRFTPSVPGLAADGERSRQTVLPEAGGEMR